MSDFDKEAEREKLREKFEKEDEQRQATEQMSELLLKGATMTNAHCTDCGDPIFRYDGQEFCPTCQKPVARDRGEDGEDADDQIEVADPSDDATVQFGASEEAANGTEREAEPTQERQSQQPSQPQQPPAQQAPNQSVPSADPDHTRDTSPAEPQTATDRGSPDAAVTQHLSEAESLLAETVNRFARRAAETEEPRTAREHLKAAREAAETLDELRF